LPTFVGHSLVDRLHLVFDVGGTLLRGALYDAAYDATESATPGALRTVRKAAAPSYARHPGASWDDLRRVLIGEMSAMRADLDPRGEVASAVVAFPGPVDRAGRVLAAPTLWGSGAGSGAGGAGTVARPDVYPYDLARDLEEAWPGVRVMVLNDVTAAGYRYLRDADDEFCIVTVSTGIGNKVFAHGRPLTGPLGTGGEIGHLSVEGSVAGSVEGSVVGSVEGSLDASVEGSVRGSAKSRDGALLCDCGGRGHLGAIASGRGSEQRARAEAERDPAAFRASFLAGAMGLRAQTITAEALAVAYRQEDPWATGVMADALAALAGVFATTHLAIGVSRFILVGGFAFGLGPRFCEALARATNARCWRGDGAAVSVILGEPDGACALLGGGRAARTRV
jgi:predicted NBD/HSP70 family sugar kinase